MVLFVRAVAKAKERTDYNGLYVERFPKAQKEAEKQDYANGKEGQRLYNNHKQLHYYTQDAFCVSMTESGRTGAYQIRTKRMRRKN